MSNMIISGRMRRSSHLGGQSILGQRRVALVAGFFGRRSRVRAAAIVATLAGGLAACGQLPGVNNPFGGSTGPGGPSSANISGQTLGTGPVRVAFLAPITRNGAPNIVGEALRNAADLAIADTGGASVTLLIKDTGGSEGGAQAAANTSIREGAKLILGPLFANNVRAVGRVARGANVPMIAFSTDTSAAARNVYLLSFLIENYVDRIVSYAASQGKRSIAALVPNSTYGRVALAELQQAAARRRMRVVAVERYSRGSAGAAASRIGAIARQIDALFIPEQAQAMAPISSALIAAGIDTERVLIMGTGLWNDSRVLGLPLLQGAVYAAPDNAGFNAFAGRYRARFKKDPTRIATLAYDAVTLAVALAGQQNDDRFAQRVLTNPSGFNGADGLFRFRADGTNQRGLAVLKIQRGSTSVVSPAPRSFSTRSGT